MRRCNLTIGADLLAPDIAEFAELDASSWLTLATGVGCRLQSQTDTASVNSTMKAKCRRKCIAPMVVTMSA